ncbi:MAG: prepilin-type N-terminal cleavage/methylation domain-containing protein [Candidatus Zambryskibacteria bacterium]|nr:prepilin-type N-terminal cleavage/methylation domain-containing protein [Candidatus Zambryskibacteria bacterium]
MRRYFKKYNSGFSLVELLVSLSIMVVILTVVVSSQSVYTDTASISNLADEISITLSQSQAYGIAVRELTPGSSDFSVSYGLTFSLLSGGSNSAYLFFADRNANNIYDGDWTCPTGGSSECLEKVSITHGNYIDSICIIREGEADVCNTSKRLDVNFVRPDTDARIVFFNDGGQTFTVPNMTGARIILKTPRDNSRSVLVYTNGQISVEGP